jgi:N-acetylneuraminic acid mutarotase
VPTSQAAINAWIKLSPSGALPSVRGGHSMVYDSAANKVIMFGGLEERSITRVPLNDTWAYDPTANTWTNLSPAGALPSARAYPSMVYTPATNKVIMFGGTSNGTFLNDTRAYDPTANTWTNLNPTGALPSPRWAHSMVYDSTTGKVILFGGMSGPVGNPDFNDTWAYDPTANTWTKLSPAGAVPSARDSFSMVYDQATNRVILFGGVGARSPELNDTWVYDPTANTWSNLSPAGTLPPVRYSPAMVYEATGGRVLMFGGEFGKSGALNDTWAYDPAANTWTNLNPPGALPYPSARVMVYDSASNKVIMFGGNSSNVALNDTWSYNP